MLFLSYVLDLHTPTYGNRNQFNITKKSSILEGDVANDSSIETTVHIGTHIDMPYHFYEDGQTIEDFSDDFWVFENILIVEIKPKNIIIKEELIEILNDLKSNKIELIIVKTDICNIREKDEFWKNNYGFHPDIYDYLVEKFPNIRVLGFDSISVSSFSERILGRESHKRFLNPSRPILLLEDMDLREISKNTSFDRIIIAPLRIAKCDGLPCTIMGFSND